MKLQPYLQTSGQGPNLALLHGWGMHGGIWETILPQLEKFFTVHNIDLPGFGRSPVHNGNYDLDYVVESIDQIMTDDCYLMGWSLGGLIATELANRSSQKIKKLVTVASSPCFVATEEMPYGMSREALDTFIDRLNEDFKGTLINFLAIQTMGSPTQQSDLEALKQTVFLHGLPAEKALTGGLRILQSVNLLSTLSRLPMPVLRIYGETDTLVPIKSVDKISEAASNSQSIIFKQSGHAPFLSESEDFIKQLVNFLISDDNA